MINALAGSIEVVIAGRVLQGVAAACSRSRSGSSATRSRASTSPAAWSIVSAIFGIGGGIGLPLSGVIVDNLDLQWLFWINLIALPAAFAAHRLVPPSPPVENARVDWLGAVLLSGAGRDPARRLAGRDWGWGSPANVGCDRRRARAGRLFVGVESRVDQPLIDLQVLRRRPSPPPT